MSCHFDELPFWWVAILMSCHFDDLPSHQKVCCLPSCFSAAWSEIFLFDSIFLFSWFVSKEKAKHLSLRNPAYVLLKLGLICPSVRPPVHSSISLSKFTSVHLLISQSLHLSICKLSHLSICSCIHLPVQVYICSSVNQSKFTSVNLSTGPTVYLFIHPFACPSLHLFICQSIQLYICQSVNCSNRPSVHSPICLSKFTSVHLSIN